MTKEESRFAGQNSALIGGPTSALIKLVATTTPSKPARTPFEALSKDAQNRLRELMMTLDPLGKLVARARGQTKVAGKSKGHASHRDLRLPKPGEVLRRYYQGRAITVRVLESGFEFEGRRYRSLSALAKEITGAHWNGLLFFGIVRQER